MPQSSPLVAHQGWQRSPSPGTRQAVKIQNWSPSAAANFPGNSALPNRLQPRPLSVVLYDLVPDDLFNSCLLFSFLSLSCRTKLNSLHFSKLHAILEGEKKTSYDFEHSNLSRFFLPLKKSSRTELRHHFLDRFSKCHLWYFITVSSMLPLCLTLLQLPSSHRPGLIHVPLLSGHTPPEDRAWHLSSRFQEQQA